MILYYHLTGLPASLVNSALKYETTMLALKVDPLSRFHPGPK